MSSFKETVTATSTSKLIIYIIPQLQKHLIAITGNSMSNVS